MFITLSPRMQHQAKKTIWAECDPGSKRDQTKRGFCKPPTRFDQDRRHLLRVGDKKHFSVEEPPGQLQDLAPSSPLSKVSGRLITRKTGQVQQPLVTVSPIWGGDQEVTGWAWKEECPEEGGWLPLSSGGSL